MRKLAILLVYDWANLIWLVTVQVTQAPADAMTAEAPSAVV